MKINIKYLTSNIEKNLRICKKMSNRDVTIYNSSEQDFEINLKKWVLEILKALKYHKRLKISMLPICLEFWIKSKRKNLRVNKIEGFLTKKLWIQRFIKIFEKVFWKNQTIFGMFSLQYFDWFEDFKEPFSQ